MPVKAQIHAVEKSTLVITAVFTDELGLPVTPTSVAWRLESDSGATINNRSNVSLTPAPTVKIVLTGADLDVLVNTNDSELRRLILTAVYSSSNGVGLSLSESYEFQVLNTNAVTT